MTNKNVEQFLSTHKTAFNLILPHEVPHDEVKKLIVVDTDQWQRLDRLEKLATRQDLEIDLWDHHMIGTGDISADLVLQRADRFNGDTSCSRDAKETDGAHPSRLHSYADRTL